MGAKVGHMPSAMHSTRSASFICMSSAMRGFWVKASSDATAFCEAGRMEGFAKK
jgi:hypothetical protein